MELGRQEDRSPVRRGLNFMDYPRYRNEDNYVNRRPRVMPDNYEGRKSWLEFLAHFENCAELNEWTNYQKAQYLRVSLRGPACQFLGTLPEYKRRDYDELVAALGRRFNPENQTELYRAQLRNLQREDNRLYLNWVKK